MKVKITNEMKRSKKKIIINNKEEKHCIAFVTRACKLQTNKSGKAGIFDQRFSIILIILNTYDTYAHTLYATYFFLPSNKDLFAC